MPKAAFRLFHSGGDAPRRWMEAARHLEAEAGQAHRLDRGEPAGGHRCRGGRGVGQPSTSQASTLIMGGDDLE